MYAGRCRDQASGSAHFNASVCFMYSKIEMMPSCRMIFKILIGFINRNINVTFYVISYKARLAFYNSVDPD